MAFLRDSQPLEELGGVTFRVPASQLGKLGLQLACPDAVLIGKIRLCVKGVLFLCNFVDAGVTQNHRFQHLLIVVLELILPQDRHPKVLRDSHLPGGGLQLPGKNLQKGGFPRPVGADDAVAVAGGELEGGPCEELLPSKGQADVGNIDQLLVLQIIFAHSCIDACGPYIIAVKRLLYHKNGQGARGRRKGAKRRWGPVANSGVLCYDVREKGVEFHARYPCIFLFPGGKPPP